MQPVFITGEKVYFRGVEEADADGPYLEWLNDGEVTRFLSTVGRFPTSKESLVNYIRGMNKSENDILFAIHDKKTGEFIGTSHLGPINWIDRTTPVGIMIGNRQYWGKGYATDALKLVLEYSFNRLNLNKVTAGVAAGNRGSAKAFQNAGFKIEGTMENQVFIGGKYYDAMYLGMTRQSDPGKTRKNKTK